MSHSEQSFSSFYSRMSLFQRIAAQNGYDLKELLVKKVGVEEELAAALIAAWNAEQEAKEALQPFGGLSRELFDSYLRDIGSFQRLAALQGADLQDWLAANCGIDAAAAEALVVAAGAQLPQKNAALLEVLNRPEDLPPPIAQVLPQGPAGERPSRGTAGRRAIEEDMVITISGAPDETSTPSASPPQAHDLEAQIDRLHAAADNPRHSEPVQLIAELKDIRLKKNYLQNPVCPEEKNRAERLLRDREEQKKTLLKLEKKLEEARQAKKALQDNPPRLFGREGYRVKIQESQEETARIESRIAALAFRETERQSSYLAATALLERHARAQREMDSRYRVDEEKFKAAQQNLIQALHWAQLDIPGDILCGSVMERLSWYESFFKTFPDKIDLPVHGWIKAYPIANKLACDYPLWRGEIENIHFVVDSEMKSLKESIRLFLDGFVAQLKEPFQAVCQLKVIKSEAETARGQAMQELAVRREKEMRASFDERVLEFCSRELGFFFSIQSLSEYLNFETKVRNFFEDLDHACRRLSRPGAGKGLSADRFAGLSEASARELEACFNAVDEIAALSARDSLADTMIPCRDMIRADFEKLFAASRERLKRYQS